MPQTAGRPARKMPAFSRPISSSVATEPFRVIDADRNDDRDVGVDDVDGIEPAAQADLEHDRVRRVRSRTTSSAASVLNSKNVSESWPSASAMRSNAAISDASDTIAPSRRMRSR